MSQSEAVNEIELAILRVLRVLQLPKHPPGSWFSVSRTSQGYVLEDHTGDQKILRLRPLLATEDYMVTLDGDGKTLIGLVRKLAFGNTLKISKSRDGHIDFSVPRKS